jgi:hypothetical protein
VDRGDLERLLGELRERNVDNVARTESYLELYALTRERPPELPWLLMAHLVSRNAGYLMCDLALAIDRADGVFRRDALEEMFLFLERANYLIFLDAWDHVVRHLLGDSQAGGGASRFMRDAWARYEAALARGLVPALERDLVFDLVQNEQTLIEHNVVHEPEFARARAVVHFIEASGKERPMALPLTDARIKVGGFLRLEQRIDTGRRIFDEVLRDPGRRAAIYDWARVRPHTGSRAVAGGRETPHLRDLWPVRRVRALWSKIHAAPRDTVSVGSRGAHVSGS